MPVAKRRPNPSPAKKPGSIASFRRVARVAGRKRPEPRSNSGGKPSIVMRVGAGVGGFAAANIGAFILKKVLANKLANLQKILGPAGGLAVFGALWYGTGKIVSLRKYRLELLVGSGLAVVQHTLAAMIPSLAWLGGEQTPKQLVAAQQQQAALQGPPRTRYVIPGEIESERREAEIKAGTWGKPQYAQQQTSGVTDEEGPTGNDEVDELAAWDNEEEELDDVKGGIFSN